MDTEQMDQYQRNMNYQQYQQQRQQQQQQQQQQYQQSHRDQQQQNSHRRHNHSPCNLFSLFVGLCIIHLTTCNVLANPLKQQQQQQQQQQQLQLQLQQKQLQIATNASALRVEQCREGCLEKFTTTESICRQQSECLTCWDECNRTPPPKLSKTIRETWSLHTVSMLQQDSLVLVDVAWEPLSLPNQCLVTWEVAGGGLMGNLLTESFNVQLSLWPDTKYRVQVTCKNKLTGLMSRSLPLIIDTSEAVKSLDTNLPQSNLHPTLRKQAISAYITSIPLRTSTTTTITAMKTKNIATTKSRKIAVSTTTLGTNIMPTMTNNLLTNNHNNQYDITNNNDHNLNNDNHQSSSSSSSLSSSSSSSSNDNKNAMNELQVKNFIFNWHKAEENGAVSAVQPIDVTKSNLNLNIFTLTTLSEIQKPLCYGMLLLIIVLIAVCCLMRQQRVPRSNDKRILIDENEIQKQATSMPPVDLIVAGKNSIIRPEDICKDPANCSRYILKV